MKEYIIPSDNFIAGWYIDHKVCDGLISYFDDSPDQGPGEIGSGIREEYKVSTDVAVIPRVNDERIQTYLDTLGRVCDNYIERYPWCSTNHSGWGINTCFNIQKYNPNEGFYGWHTERSTYKSLVSTRHLTFMTYLNDVTDAGETEWYHQRLKIQPQKGLTIIWPCDWTHTHRGVPSPTQVKYITTGWYTYKVEGVDYTEFNGG